MSLREQESGQRKQVKLPRIGWRVCEWATMTGMSRQTAWRQIRSGKLIAADVNGIKVIPRTEAVRLGLLPAEVA
jgi:hypothetical protein